MAMGINYSYRAGNNQKYERVARYSRYARKNSETDELKEINTVKNTVALSNQDYYVEYPDTGELKNHVEDKGGKTESGDTGENNKSVFRWMT